MTTFGIIVLWGSAIYHFIMGLLSMFTVETIRKVAFFLYDLKIEEKRDPKYEYIWKPLGASAVIISLFTVRALYVEDLEYQKFVIQMLSLLYFLRTSFRFFYRKLFFQAFHVTFQRNLVNISFNLVLVILMLQFSFK